MKDIEKMTKEELREYIKELEGNKEEQEESEELDIEDVKEKIEEILDGASCIVCCTDKGILNVGYQKDIMNILTHIAQTLKQGMPKDMIKFAIENGLCDDNLSAFKHLIEELTNRLGE